MAKDKESKVGREATQVPEPGSIVTCSATPSKRATVIRHVPERGTVIIAYDHTAEDGTRCQTFGEYPPEELR